mgnify:CR=1 FL=1
MKNLKNLVNICVILNLACFIVGIFTGIESMWMHLVIAISLLATSIVD